MSYSVLSSYSEENLSSYQENSFIYDFSNAVNVDERSTEEQNNMSVLRYGQQISLWSFLLELLQNPRNQDIIAWVGNDGEFRLNNPSEVARQWGRRKGNPNMDYDKFSRAIRYYYRKNIISKIRGRRYTYKFNLRIFRDLFCPKCVYLNEVNCCSRNEEFDLISAPVINVPAAVFHPYCNIRGRKQ